MLTIARLDDWFSSVAADVTMDDDVKAYAVGVLSARNISIVGGSIVLEFASARETCDFKKYQKIGDSVLFCSIVHGASRCAVDRDLARLSYYRCHAMTGKKLLVYCKLADDFDSITSALNAAIFATKSQ